MARSTSAHLSSQAPEVSADTGEPGMTAKMDTLYAVRQQRSHHLPISPLAEKLLPNCVWVVGGWMDGWEDTWTETHMESWSSGVSLLWLTEVRSHVVGSADFPFQSVNANLQRQAAGMLA